MDQQKQSFLRNVKFNSYLKTLLKIIRNLLVFSSHAGYSYCGATAAYAFKHVVPDDIDTVFILGPSHHVRLNGCALTRTLEYETPLYNLIIDQECKNKAMTNNRFLFGNYQFVCSKQGVVCYREI